MTSNLQDLLKLAVLTGLAAYSPGGAAVLGAVLIASHARDSLQAWIDRSKANQTAQLLALQESLAVTQETVARLDTQVKNLTMAKLGRS